MSNSSRADQTQDRDVRDLAFSKMSKDLRHWLSEVSPLIFSAQSCLEMEQQLGTYTTINFLREALREETKKTYGKSYPLLKDVHFEAVQEQYIDPHVGDIWAFANR